MLISEQICCCFVSNESVLLQAWCPWSDQSLAITQWVRGGLRLQGRPPLSWLPLRSCLAKYLLIAEWLHSKQSPAALSLLHLMHSTLARPKIHTLSLSQTWDNTVYAIPHTNASIFRGPWLLCQVSTKEQGRVQIGGRHRDYSRKRQCGTATLTQCHRSLGGSK